MARAGDKDRQGDDRHRPRVRQRTGLLDGDVAQPAAGEAAKAPEAVRRRHDRPAEPALDCDRVRVHGDVHAADDAAEDEHEHRRDRHVRRGDDGEQAEYDDRSEADDDGARFAAGEQYAGDRHQGQRAEAEAEDQQAQRELVDAEAFDERRDCGAQLPTTNPLRKNMATTAQRARTAM